MHPAKGSIWWLDKGEKRGEGLSILRFARSIERVAYSSQTLGNKLGDDTDVQFGSAGLFVALDAGAQDGPAEHGGRRCGFVLIIGRFEPMQRQRFDLCLHLLKDAGVKLLLTGCAAAQVVRGRTWRSCVHTPKNLSVK